MREWWLTPVHKGGLRYHLWSHKSHWLGSWGQKLPELFHFLLLSLFSLVLQEFHGLSLIITTPTLFPDPSPTSYPILHSFFVVVVVNLSSTVCAAHTPLDEWPSQGSGQPNGHTLKKKTNSHSPSNYQPPISDVHRHPCPVCWNFIWSEPEQVLGRLSQRL